MYQFLDDPTRTDAQLLDGVSALPTPVPIEHVPASERLWALADQHGSWRSGFCAWASELLDKYDTYRSEADRRGLDQLGDLIADATDAFQGSERFPLNPEIRRRRTDALLALREKGMTLRQMAETTGLPLTRVLAVLVPARNVGSPDAYASLEEHLLEHGVDDTRERLAARYGLGESSVRTLCGWHGLASTTPTNVRQKWTVETVEALAEIKSRKKGQPVLDEFVARYPEFAGNKLTSLNETYSKVRKQLMVGAIQ